MKSSCLPHPANEPLVVIRKWQIEFCDGNVCAAALLSFFEYWHNVKVSQSEKAKHANKVAEQHGDAPTQDTSLLQWHTEKELEDGVLIYGKTAIAAAITKLVHLKALKVQRNPNKRYAWDRTRYFTFLPDTLINWLKNRKPDSGASSPESGSRSTGTVLPSLKSGGESTGIGSPIAETTTETSQETTTEATQPQAPPSPVIYLDLGDEEKPKEQTVTKEEFIKVWNSLGKPFSKINPKAPSEARWKTLEVRARNPWWRDNWRAAIVLAVDRPFLRGENGRGWVMDPDFFLRPESVTMIMEGKYAGQPGAATPAQPKGRVLTPLPPGYRFLNEGLDVLSPRVYGEHVAAGGQTIQEWKAINGWRSQQ